MGVCVSDGGLERGGESVVDGDGDGAGDLGSPRRA